MKKLNIGCGHDIKEEWVNLDASKLPGVDVAHNLEDLPLPFPDEEFDHILAKDVLEHLEYIPVLKELHRILKPGGILEIYVPHFTSVDNFVDPTHKKMFSTKTFEFFTSRSPYSRTYYFDFVFSEIVKTRIIFLKGILFYNFFLEMFVNSTVATRKLFEVTGLSRLFPAQNIHIILRK